MDELACTYCGSANDIVRDHVIPASYFGIRTFNPDKQWLVDACSICNTLAGDATFFSIAEKAAYILTRYKRHYRKVLAIPYWSPSELQEIGYGLRVAIEQSQIAKALVQRRMARLTYISEFPTDYLRPTWVEAEARWWREQQLAMKKKRKRRKRHAKTTVTA